ncbi:cell wall-associated NlpC family hydrolase [Streptomyces olivoverticillatus]|uniref:Cell wall-associated NlpC family hydrolase n=1 Tax=Streptomyces olivoverticillatus TaxID=66427 RepID=A0A7W7LLT7_9ACTN|nr:cell wall-associated NlpC family hydrolase [Streptomyces olivoverticillatus]
MGRFGRNGRGGLSGTRAGGGIGVRARGRLVVATAVVCAVTGAVGVLGASGVAYADPGPGGSGSVSDGPGGGDSPSLEQVHQRVETLYRKAEAATDAYNAAGAQQHLQEKSITEIAKAVTAAQERMDRLRNQAGALARAQYRSGGLTPQTQLFFSASPDNFLKGVPLLRKGEQATRGLLSQVAATRAELEGYAKDASDRWKKLDDERKKKEAAKKEVEGQLEEARKLESRLQEKEQERLRQLEEDQARQAQQKWLASDAAKGLAGLGSGAATSAEGKRAVDFATAQIGKDYVWGAEGPETYDCSGLTLKAWAAAGRAIPRTSQEQWQQLPKVDVKDMRPGDLVIYFSDASHVGMYVGDGRIVHAPRPGRQVTLTGAGTMPILGVVRPG